jgi:hypothetical protein
MVNIPKELQKFLEKILSSISDEYYIDLYLPDFKVATGVDLSNRDKLIENTITVYKKHHKDFDSDRIKKINDDLQEIVKKDTVIYLDNTLIYKELYKILLHIDLTFGAEKLLLDPKYPYGFAKIQSDMRIVNRFRSKQKDNLVGDFRLHNRREPRLKYWLLTLYHHNPALVKFFLHNFLLVDIDKLKCFHEADEEINDIILKDMEYFLMQHTTISAVLKSLGILLYYELINFLKYSYDDAEVRMKSIIYKLFNDTVSSHEFRRNVYLKSSLGFLPIFGASKQSYMITEDKNFIKKKLLSDPIGFYNINSEHFNLFFDSFMKNPHIHFLQKYPVEFFRKNPKYSHLNI